MNRLIFVTITVIIWSFTCIFGGYTLGKNLVKPILVQGETVWKDRVVYRNYTTMTPAEKDEKLKCYDMAEFKIDIKQNLDLTTFRINSSLCERSAYKDVEIQVGESENWKFYVGAGVAVAAGTAIYMGTK